MFHDLIIFTYSYHHAIVGVLTLFMASAAAFASREAETTFNSVAFAVLALIVGSLGVWFIMPDDTYADACVKREIGIWGTRVTEALARKHCVGGL
jgi:hypothetical protein